ncbi:MAG TPA: hypothetical protein PKC65_13715 [Pyrinomonadaceae bacterium]|nr:hypothetical protein [Pyrinomonadaceae bacterium]
MTSHEIRDRLISLFAADKTGRRRVNGGSDLLDHDEHFKDLILFYECFHGDNGRGIDASHQTGWTALIAEIIRKRTAN